MSRHVTVLVAGMDVTGDSIGELEISGGRGDWLSDTEPASLSLSLEWPAWAPIPVLGDPVLVSGWLPHTGATEQSVAALFAGQVTDVAVEGDVVSLLAVDQARLLDGLVVGDEPWPAETWAQRLHRLRDVVGARLPAADRAWWSQWQGWPGEPGSLAAGTVAYRDVDAQDALQLLRDHMRPAGRVFWHLPHFEAINTTDPAPADPRMWRPATGHVSLFPDNPRFFQQVPQVPAAWIVDGHRAAQNLSTCINRLEVTGPHADASGKPVDADPATWAWGASVPESTAARHGLRSGGIDTMHAIPQPGATATWPVVDPPRVTAAWLARTGWPTWSVDSVVVDFTQPDPDRPGFEMLRAWLWLAQGGAARCGQPVALHGITGSTVGPAPGEDDPNWIVEQRTIRWTETGWEVELTALTDPAVYLGTVGPPVDPRSRVSLAAPPPPAVRSGGTLLQPLVQDGGRTGAAGGWWRIVAPDLGLSGPAVMNTGIGCLVPTPHGLPAGLVRLVVQQLAAADATAPRWWLELHVQVEPAARWVDVPAGVRWTDVPAGVRWVDAVDVDTITGR